MLVVINLDALRKRGLTPKIILYVGTPTLDEILGQLFALLGVDSLKRRFSNLGSSIPMMDWNSSSCPE